MTSGGPPSARAFVEWLAAQDPRGGALSVEELVDHARQVLAHESGATADTPPPPLSHSPAGPPAAPQQPGQPSYPAAPQGYPQQPPFPPVPAPPPGYPAAPGYPPGYPPAAPGAYPPGYPAQQSGPYPQPGYPPANPAPPGAGIPAAQWAVNPVGSAVVNSAYQRNQAQAAALGPGYQPPLNNTTGGMFAQLSANGMLPQDMTNDQIAQQRAQMPQLSPYFDPNGSVGEKSGIRQSFGSGLLPGWDALSSHDRIQHFNSLPRWAQEMLWSQMSFKQRRKFNTQRMNRPWTQF
jgi:hypothetical protein